MSENQDIRWRQRFNNYQRAYRTLEEIYDLSQQRGLSKIEGKGLIQTFEYTHELSWKLLKDYLSFQGIANIIGSKDAVRQGFALGLISEGQIWMNMIESRNLSSHSYDEIFAKKLTSDILHNYYPKFTELYKKFSDLAKDK
ncbi:MAG: nucleotidyltransferase substrate binding protein [Alphaproteobacteria bacterium]|nr:nucleotidyltransferase substrate binding protein [Alphaproteobacteria bacterium]